MKKIIFIANNNIGSGFSGGDRIFIEFIKNWAEKLEIVLVGSEEAIKIARDRNIPQISIIKTDERADYENLDSVWLAIKHAARRARKGTRAIKKNYNILGGADYVYSVSDFYPDLVPALCLKIKSRKTKWIAGYYLFAPSPFSKSSPYKEWSRIKGFLYWLGQRFSYFAVKRWADFIFVTSEPDAEKFITKRRGREKIIVVRGGVNVAESEKYLASGEAIPAEKRKYDACFVGRLHPQKGVLELVDIWKKVCEKKTGAKLAMIGNGPLEEKMRDKINKYNLEYNIEMLGFKDGSEKYDIFKQSKMILHPAIYDSGGMAAAEGLAWGLPGVSFDLLPLKTYYPRGVLKATCFDLDEFARKILLLLQDKNLYNKMSREALALVREKWDWKKRSVGIFESIYERKN